MQVGISEGYFTDIRFVLFDFDGPICRLFGRHHPAGVAHAVRTELTRHGASSAGLEHGDRDNAHALLRELQRTGAVAPDALLRAEDVLTAQEMRAAEVAEPTPGVRRLIGGLASRGMGLAVTSNNAAQAIRLHLDRASLGDFFGAHVYGRRPGALDRLKPHPDCIERALAGLGVAGQEKHGVLIGDSVADAEAAAACDLPFVGFTGYAQQPDRNREALLDAGAVLVTGDLDDLTRVLVTAAPGGALTQER